MTKDEAMEKFKQFCLKDVQDATVDRANLSDDNYVEVSIDPSQEQDWYSLSLGYFVALGFPSADCREMALEARYTHHYWCE